MTEPEEVLLRFEALGASLSLRHANDLQLSRGLQFAVRLTERMGSPSGTALNEFEWNVAVDEGDVYNKHAENMGALGFMLGPHRGGFEHFERGLIACVIGRSTFEPLLAAILAGRLPTAITVAVKSAAVTWHPDHSREVIWDPNGETPPVVRIEFFTPIIEAARSEVTEFASQAPNLLNAPATSNDVQALAKNLREILTAGQAQVRIIAICALVFVLLFLFLHR